MDSQLVKIKRLVASGHYAFTMKADLECAADGLTREDVTESILTAQFLRIKNSRSPWRRGLSQLVNLAVLRRHRGAALLRLGLHPVDMQHASARRFWTDTLTHLLSYRIPLTKSTWLDQAA